MFYIVGKAEKQAKRWELKVEQSAVSMFYIVDGLKNRRIVVSKSRTECVSMFQMPVFLKDILLTTSLPRSQVCHDSQVCHGLYAHYAMNLYNLTFIIIY